MSVKRGSEFPPDSLRNTGGSIPSLSTVRKGGHMRFLILTMLVGCVDTNEKCENPPCDEVCSVDLVMSGQAKLMCFDGPGNDRCVCQSVIDPLTICRITCEHPGPDGICGTIDDGGQ
jgi:hypothetical protein